MEHRDESLPMDADASDSLVDRETAPPGGDSPKSDLQPTDLQASGLREGELQDDDELHEDLLLQFQAGDRAAFERIVGRYEAPLWRFFHRLCWDRERAEDFVQDVFLRVYRSAHRYQPRGRLSTFFYRIATNRWIDHWRSMRPRPTLYSLDSSESDDDSPIRDRVASTDAGPMDVLEQDSQKARLRAALDSLTMPHRLVFELAVYQNLPYPQISELLGIPVGTVKSRMHNTTRALKQILDPDAAAASRPRQGRRSFRA